MRTHPSARQWEGRGEGGGDAQPDTEPGRRGGRDARCVCTAGLEAAFLDKKGGLRPSISDEDFVFDIKGVCSARHPIPQKRPAR